MSDAKFTPGPWRAESWNDVDSSCRPNSCGDYFVVSGEYDMCYMAHHVVSGIDHTKQDANLIAAAPDLYEALVVAATSMAVSGYAEDHPAIKTALTALSKARGES